MNKGHINRVNRIKQGDCDVCGEYSVMLVGGICQKQVCNRRVEEGKAELQEQLAQSERLAYEYAGQGNE